MQSLSPFKIIGAWLFFVLSFACPPLLLVSVPVLLVTLGQLARRVVVVRRSRDYYREEHDLMMQSKLWRSR